MSKKIQIEKCSQCPHNDHMGAFAFVKYVPVCRLTNQNQAYVIGQDGHFGRVAKQVELIPEWCPLPGDVEPVKAASVVKPGAVAALETLLKGSLLDKHGNRDDDDLHSIVSRMPVNSY